MAFDLHEEARQQVRVERKAELVKKYRDTRSQLLQAEKDLDAAKKKAEGLRGSLEKVAKEGEDEFGEGWH
jgi:hypothetical protein